MGQIDPFLAAARVPFHVKDTGKRPTSNGIEKKIRFTTSTLLRAQCYTRPDLSSARIGQYSTPSPKQHECVAPRGLTCFIDTFYKKKSRTSAGSSTNFRSVLIFACLSHLTIDHASLSPFRDGAPFLFLIETPPACGRSLRFFHILHRKWLLILPPSCFAVCGHHPSPRIAIVFSLLSIMVYQTLPCHIRLISSPPLTHPVPPCVFNILLQCEP